MPHVLLLATTTGYQTRAFGDAAGRLGVDLVFATDRCDVLDDPWRDRAVPIRFFDEAGSVATILEAHRSRPIDGVLAVGDRPTVIAAQVNRALGLPGHPPDGAAAARNKLRTRDCFRAAGLPAPWYGAFSLDDPSGVPRAASFPAVVKPVALSGSRGVMRVDDEEGLAAAVDRLRWLMRTTDLRAERDEAHSVALVEAFIPGREFAVEGLMTHGTVRALAIFDKPDPLDGPFFEETIYVTPSSAPPLVQHAIADAVTSAASALGLRHGPIHAECRVEVPAGDGGWPATQRTSPTVYVLEVAARPIGGLCARALRFHDPDSNDLISLEELLLRHALGESPGRWTRERAAAGVMMIPIPRPGVFRGLSGIEDARSVPGVDEVRITAKPDQLLVPLPEGASYPGFIFAHGERPIDVERALRAAHARLEFRIEQEVRVLQSAHG